MTIISFSYHSWVKCYLKYFRYCFFMKLWCVKYIFFWFYWSVGFQGNVNNTLSKKEITSAVECTDKTFAMRQIRAMEQKTGLYWSSEVMSTVVNESSRNRHCIATVVLGLKQVNFKARLYDLRSCSLLIGKEKKLDDRTCQKTVIRQLGIYPLMTLIDYIKRCRSPRRTRDVFVQYLWQDFSTKGSLKKHQESTHHQLAGFSFQVCSQRFYRKDHLRKHMKNASTHSTSSTFRRSSRIHAWFTQRFTSVSTLSETLNLNAWQIDDI